MVKKTQVNNRITPVHFAAINEHGKYLKALIDKMRSASATLDSRGRSPLHFAAVAPNTINVQFLISECVNPRSFDASVIYIFCLLSSLVIIYNSKAA